MSAPFNQSVNLSGLTNYSVSLANSAPYTFDWKVSLPTVVGGGGQSSVVMTITDTTNSVTVFTGTAGATGGSCVYSPAANATFPLTVRFALSSAAAADQGLNTVGATIAISQGVN